MRILLMALVTLEHVLVQVAVGTIVVRLPPLLVHLLLLHELVQLLLQHFDFLHVGRLSLAVIWPLVRHLVALSLILAHYQIIIF